MASNVDQAGEVKVQVAPLRLRVILALIVWGFTVALVLALIVASLLLINLAVSLLSGWVLAVVLTLVVAAGGAGIVSIMMWAARGISSL